ncbi:E3 ubiquitin-protein ligase SMURF1-like [Paramacrobiotus metropolitanus]|uniref:E3 ubiquitin-protein ligase SMURF1-like n=1 Tax=Paramacrobiotus metropolitanus TaxID=2943436 RepID=UPI0024460CE9|nr:E3 ubiquitin-protein ligase SMURF1-like [Paramacrobiotus metropolitanus]
MAIPACAAAAAAAASGSRRTNSAGGSQAVRLTVLCAKNLVKKEFFKFPDPFVTVVVDGSGQTSTSEVCAGTLDPKWNVHFDL